jgi:hypothetical protein
LVKSLRILADAAVEADVEKKVKYNQLKLLNQLIALKSLTTLRHYVDALVSVVKSKPQKVEQLELMRNELANAKVVAINDADLHS